MIEKKDKRTSRAETLRRLDAVAGEAVGNQTALDRAFARFERATVGDDPSALAAAQQEVRNLLAAGISQRG